MDCNDLVNYGVMSSDSEYNRHTTQEYTMLHPIDHGSWITEFTRDVFVVFDPITDGAEIVGAARSLEEADQLLNQWMEVHG